jgi:predicted PurR-regulated permease PerM
MTPERFRTVLFLAVLTLALGLCAALLFPFLRLLAWAVVLAVIAHPIHRQVVRWVRPPSVAAAITCLLVVGAVVAPSSLLVAHVVDQATWLARNLQSAAEEGKLARWMPPFEAPWVDAVYRWLEQRAGLSPSSLEAAVRDTVRQTSAFLAKQTVGMVKNVTLGIVQGGLSLVTLFFLLRDSPRLLPAARAFIPLDGAQTDALLRRVVETIHATVYGATVVAVTQGTLGGLAFWALGLPSPLLWGAVMTVLCLVPLVGAPVVWVPAALALAAQGSYGKAIALALWGALVVGLVDNFLRPLLIGARTQLHPLVVFFSIFGGLLLMGPLGLLLGPVILAVTLVLMDILKLQLTEQDGSAWASPGAAARAALDDAAAPMPPPSRGP